MPSSAICNVSAPSKLALAIINAMQNSNGDTIGAISKVADEFPEASHDEFDAACDQAATVLETRAHQHAAEAEELARLAPLFEGMPEGTSLGECARIKAEQGDPLAAEYLKWEAATYPAA